MTLGEAPTVFSLKSRRSLPMRSPVGGEYGAMRRTAWRGGRTPGGGSSFLPKAHLDGAGVSFESFGAGEGCDPRGQAPPSVGRQFPDPDPPGDIGGDPA